MQHQNILFSRLSEMLLHFAASFRCKYAVLHVVILIFCHQTTKNLHLLSVIETLLTHLHRNDGVFVEKCWHFCKPQIHLHVIISQLSVSKTLWLMCGYVQVQKSFGYCLEKIMFWLKTPEFEGTISARKAAMFTSGLKNNHYLWHYSSRKRSSVSVKGIRFSRRNSSQ